MTAPEPHRSAKAPRDLAWDWAKHRSRYTHELLRHGAWRAMALAHAWHKGDAPERKSSYKLPHHRLINRKVRVVLTGVKAAMNILAATRFNPEHYQVKLPADEVPHV